MRRAGKINPRALCDGRGKSTRGRCATGGENQPAGIVRRAGRTNPRALCDVREKLTHGHCAAGGKKQPTGVARRAGKINPRALRGGREKSTHGHCAAGGKNQPTGIVRRAGRTNPRALCGGRGKSTHRRCAAGGKNQPTGVVRRAGKINPRALCGKRERSAPAVPKFSSCAPLPCVAPSSPHADPAKKARADLPAGRAVVHAPCVAFGRTKKNGAETPFFLLSVYSLEPVSISEPMIIFWKIANRMMTGRTHMTAAAMTGPWF